MGWFDDDSDSEEEKKKKGRKTALFETFETERTSEGPDLTLGHDDTIGLIESRPSTMHQPLEDKQQEEEEDPLDSFMNHLSSTTEGTSVEKTGAKNRLDVENEEEATAHWRSESADASETISWSRDKIGALRDRRSQSVVPSGSDTLNTSPEAAYQSNETLMAKASMAQTFHKAGQRQHPTIAITSRDQCALDDSDSLDEDRQKRIIEPLEKINHSKIHYLPFRRKFFEPKHTSAGSLWRAQHDVTCSLDIDPIESFTEYGPGPTSAKADGIFPREVLSYLNENGFHQATKVQAQSIPAALAGYDLLVTSHTGSGKTLAYILPLVTHVMDQPHIVANVDGPIAIVLTPTRELAKQVHIVAKKVLRVVGAKVCAVTGGSGTYEMSRDLKRGCELIVSTPGRFIDMVKRKATNCKRITFVVLDEADKMLDMGFESQCASILSNVRPDRQTVMFSATFGKKVERAARGWLRNPIRIAVGRTGSSSEHVDQQIMVLPSNEAKLVWLNEMLPILTSVGKTIIFVASRADCDIVTREISGKGIAVDCIHGDKHQIDRNAALASLRKGKISALVATDVASRGLDVADVMTVVNFDPAKKIDSHVHRVGRAGRLSTTGADPEKQQKGTAYTLLTSKNADFANVLVEAFQREGREVTDELLKLAMESRHYGGGGKQRWNRSGLGYHDNTGGNSLKEPHKKRSRWGS
jgi:ATP-dependent RNA helicase DDX42